MNNDVVVLNPDNSMNIGHDESERHTVVNLNMNVSNNDVIPNRYRKYVMTCLFIDIIRIFIYLKYI